MRPWALDPTVRGRAARTLLLMFAFTAWSMTGPANVALAMLLALFLLELPADWRDLRQEPAFLLLVGVVLITTAAALRGALLFPETAGAQWQAAWAWSAPFLFVVVAWWLRRDATLVWPLMGAAALGLAVGVLRKTDWSLAPQVLAGARYDFGYAALGLAFIASVLVVGLLLFRARITGLQIGGRPRPVLGWGLWSLGLLFLIGILVATQSRGAVALLLVAGLLYTTLRDRTGGGSRPRAKLVKLGSILLITTMAATLLWATKGRYLEDWQALTQDSQGLQLSYTGSLTIRANLHILGLKAFAAQPLLGFGPGTSTTEYLVPTGLLGVTEHHRTQAPQISHLHSVALEILARFGLLGVLVASVTIALMWQAYRSLWSTPGVDPDLRAFLTLGGIMLALFSLYDFRVLNQDLRFFCILFLGLVYGIHLDLQSRRISAANG